MSIDQSDRPKGFTGQCNPEVWDMRAKPPQPTEKKVGQLSEEQVDAYFKDGVILVEDFFTKEELESVKKDIEKLVDYLADRLFEDGRIKNTYEEYGLFQRLTMISREYPGANMLLHKMGMLPQAIMDLWSGEKLCNAVEQLIGGDIGGHPVWNLRTKIPQCEASTVPWHQDCAYLDPRSYDVHQASAWIPFLDATPENGTMEFAVGGHKKGMIAEHECCEGDTHYVMLETEDMKKQLDVDIENDLKVFPVKYGSMLLFNNCIPHRSLNNLTGTPGEIRWSIDLRWQDPKREYGTFDVAEGIVFRKADDPEWRPSSAEWDKFLLKNKTLGARNVEKDLDTGDTTIAGPWMSYWKITHSNRHTAVHTK